MIGNGLPLRDLSPFMRHLLLSLCCRAGSAHPVESSNSRAVHSRLGHRAIIAPHALVTMVIAEDSCTCLMTRSQARMSLHGGWERARRQAEIDRLLVAGPLSTAIRIGTNHGQRSRRKAAGRLRIDRVTAAAIFPVQNTVCPLAISCLYIHLSGSRAAP